MMDPIRSLLFLLQSKNADGKKLSAWLQQVASRYFSGENGHLFNLFTARLDGRLKPRLSARTAPCDFKREKETLHYNAARE